MKRIFALLLMMLAVSAAASAQNNAQTLTAGEPKQAELSLEEQAKIGGIGTAGDKPFLIATAEQLEELATLVNGKKTYNDGNGSYGAAYYRMVADVDLSAYDNWVLIGNEDAPFRGTFEGNYHTIRNLTITNATQEYQGLFGWANGIIQNVLVSNANISVTYPNAAVGTIVGRNDGIVQNCAMLGGFVRGNGYVGGIVGCNISVGMGTVQNCYATGSVTGTGESAGGIVGGNGGTVRNCYATGSVTGTGNNAGGVAGIATGKTENCVALGVVVSDAINVNRVVGAGGSEGLKNNYAWSGMKANGRIVTDGQADNENGEDILASGGLLYDKSGQIFAWPGFDASVWKLRNTEEGRLPSLRMGGDPTMPLEVRRAEVRYAVNLTAGTGVSGFRCKVNDAADFTRYSPDLTVALADKLEIEPVLQQNYVFAQWSDGRTNAVYTVDSARREIELTASANAVEYAIAYELGGGALKAGETNPETYTAETETFTLNNPTREGYIFAGWTGTNLDRVSKEVTIAKGTTGALSYTANWAIEQRGVTLTGGTGISGFEYRVNGGGLKTCDQQATIPVLYGSTLEIKAIAAPGYRFTKWGDGETKNPRTVKANEAVTLEASADAVEYAIAYELGGGALKAGETNPETYTAETETFTLNNPTREGYIFAGWTGSNGTTPELTVEIKQGTMGELRFTANWTTEEKPTPTLKVESSASLIVGMATEDVIVRIGEGVPNFGAANFKSVDLDGKPIDPKFYQVRNGSIILTIEKAFLNTLSVGEHALNVQLKGEGYEEQTVSMQITVSPAPDASRLPQTGDDSPILLWCAAFGACAAGLVVMLARKKK